MDCQDCSRALPPWFYLLPRLFLRLKEQVIIMWKDEVSERWKQKRWKRPLLGSHETNKGIACLKKRTLDPHAPYKACIWPQCAISFQSGNIWPLLPLSENRCLPWFDKQALAREIRSCFVLVFFSFLTSTLTEVIMCTEWTTIRDKSSWQTCLKWVL